MSLENIFSTCLYVAFDNSVPELSARVVARLRPGSKNFSLLRKRNRKGSSVEMSRQDSTSTATDRGVRPGQRNRACGPSYFQSMVGLTLDIINETH
jgi:hypothetical protein